MRILFSLFLFQVCFLHVARAQKVVAITDTLIQVKQTPAQKDSVKKYNPNIAIRQSAMIPGWGQITNKRVWKVPIIYGALGTTAFVFFRNIHQYKDARNAYKLATDGDTSNDFQIKQPYFNVKDQPQRIQAFRNSVRQNVDYSALVFIIFWGLNVADAAVDANLKTFDVSDDLSLNMKAGYSPMAKTAGLSFVLNIGK